MYYLNPRRKWSGRELIVAYDERFPLFTGFKNNSSCIVRFFERGNCAGNRYHKIRGEMMLPIQGSFEIFLEDINTGKRDSFLIDLKENVAFYVGVGIAHAMKSREVQGLILEMAAVPARESDIFPHPIA